MSRAFGFLGEGLESAFCFEGIEYRERRVFVRRGPRRGLLWGDQPVIVFVLMPSTYVPLQLMRCVTEANIQISLGQKLDQSHTSLQKYQA